MSAPAAPVSRYAINLGDPEFREMRRSLAIERGAINKEDRTVEFSFASEAPVDRWYGREVLAIAPEACDLSRLLGGGACLVNHDWDDQVGVVTKAWLDVPAKKARCIVKFSRSVRGSEIFQDIADGIRSLISVGYSVRKMVLQSVDGDVETHRVTEWQPFEVSLVAVPADPSVGVGRSKPKEEPAATPAPAGKTLEKPSRKMETAIATTTAPAVETRAAAPVTQGINDVAAERARVRELNAAAETLSRQHPDHAEAFRALAFKCAETGDTIDAFRSTVLNDILGTKKTLTPVRQTDGGIGMSDRDKREYSILKAIREQIDGKLTGREREMSDEVSRKLERAPRGFFLPDDMVRYHRSKRNSRGYDVTTPANGGFTVGQTILANELETLLRNQTRVVQLGARVISGLVGDVSIPRQLTGATAYWVAENGSITQSAGTFGQIVGKPRRIGTSVPYTKQFLAQTSLDAESFVVQDSDEAIAVELDRVAIRGAGASEPLGILNLASADRSTSVTFGAAPTWLKYLEFFGNVATSNALLGRPSYLTTPASAVKAMGTARFSGGDTGIWDDTGKIGMFPAEWSNQFPTSGTLNQVIFGDFSQVLFLEWAGRDVVVDPFTGKKEGTVEVTIQRLIDMVVRRAKSFAISADSGAQ